MLWHQMAPRGHWPGPAPAECAMSDVVTEWQRGNVFDWAGRQDLAYGVGELESDGNTVAKNAGIIVELR